MINPWLDGCPTEVNRWGICHRCHTLTRSIWTVKGWSDYFHATIEQAWLCKEGWYK